MEIWISLRYLFWVGMESTTTGSTIRIINTTSRLSDQFGWYPENNFLIVSFSFTNCWSNFNSNKILWFEYQSVKTYEVATSMGRILVGFGFNFYVTQRYIPELRELKI